MGILGWSFGTLLPPKTQDGRSEDSRDMNKTLLDRIRGELLNSGVPAASDVVVEGDQLMICGRRLAVSVEIREANEEKTHAHVVSWLPAITPRDPPTALDACVVALGPTETAIEQVAMLWLHLVGSAILSGLSGHVVLNADHFAGDENWGIPDGHGFVGPFMVRGGTEGAVEMESLARCEAFHFDKYPRDGQRHLAKVTLVGGEAGWARYLEIDGHSITHFDENWSTELPTPRAPVICVRFAVFDLKA